VFTKNGGLWLENIAACGADCVGLDWTIDIGSARQRIGERVALQGNMDPSVLYAAAPRIRADVAGILASFGTGNGHVFNLGHGIHQHVNPDHAKVFIDAVHELSAPYHD
jgi:uroporphyrinogen decarboxylase